MVGQRGNSIEVATGGKVALANLKENYFTFEPVVQVVIDDNGYEDPFIMGRTLIVFFFFEIMAAVSGYMYIW